MPPAARSAATTSGATLMGLHVVAAEAPKPRGGGGFLVFAACASVRAAMKMKLRLAFAIERGLCGGHVGGRTCGGGVECQSEIVRQPLRTSCVVAIEIPQLTRLVVCTQVGSPPNPLFCTALLNGRPRPRRPRRSQYAAAKMRMDLGVFSKKTDPFWTMRAELLRPYSGFRHPLSPGPETTTRCSAARPAPCSCEPGAGAGTHQHCYKRYRAGAGAGTVCSSARCLAVVHRQRKRCGCASRERRAKKQQGRRWRCAASGAPR